MTVTRKPWYHYLTVDRLIKYMVFAGTLATMLTAVGRVVAVPYVKKEINTGIEENNEKFLKVIEIKYADKETTLKDIHKSQMELIDKLSVLDSKIARIEGRLSR